MMVRGALSGWYSSMNTSSSAEEILETAFAHARIILRATVKPQDFDSLFPPTNLGNLPGFTIHEVQRSLQAAQAVYEDRVGLKGDATQQIAPTTAISPSNAFSTPLSKTKAKARQWLTSLSQKLVHYGNIFDVFAQQHPEYTSLAWGTFKLLFTVTACSPESSPSMLCTSYELTISLKAITNHAETASKLSKSISQVADILPQHSLHLILYPTLDMQTAVARLYAHVLSFFLSSLKWYQDSRSMHAIKAVFQPWDLKFRHEFEAISEESQQINRLADLAMKAEVRDARLELGEGTKQLELITQDLRELKAENKRLTEFLEEKFGSLTFSMTNMYQEIRLDLSAQRTTLNRVHLNQMLDLGIWNNLPTSGECLQFCRSIRDRDRARIRLPLPDIHRLEAWAAQKKSTVLLIDTCAVPVAKSFMVDLIDLVRTHHLPIIWALRYADYWDRSITMNDIVRMLILQMMHAGADHLLEGQFPVTQESIREAASLADWIAILDRLLMSIRHAFIVLDADLLAHATSYERPEVLEVLDRLRLRMSGHVKIVTATSCVSRGYVEDLEDKNECVKLLSGTDISRKRVKRPNKSQTWRRKRPRQRR